MKVEESMIKKLYEERLTNKRCIEEGGRRNASFLYFYSRRTSLLSSFICYYSITSLDGWEMMHNTVCSGEDQACLLPGTGRKV
jgi:hypothetical protein